MHRGDYRGEGNQIQTLGVGTHMRTARCIIVAAVVSICGCQTVAERVPDDEGSLLGDWKGSNRLRPHVETRIEAVHEDRTVSGAACSREKSGAIVGQRLEDTALQSPSGLSIRFDIGRGSFHMHRTGPRKAAMWETWTRRDGTITRPLRTTLTRTSKPGCVERFSAELRSAAPPPPMAERPLVGQWTGQWSSGTIGELLVFDASARGQVEAIYCTRQPSGAIWIFDLRRGGPFKTRLDSKTNTITFEERWKWGRKTAYSFELQSADFARLRTADMKGRTTTDTGQLAMTRRVNPRGCLAHIVTTLGSES